MLGSVAIARQWLCNRTSLFLAYTRDEVSWFLQLTLNSAKIMCIYVCAHTRDKVFMWQNVNDCESRRVLGIHCTSFATFLQMWASEINFTNCTIPSMASPAYSYWYFFVWWNNVRFSGSSVLYGLVLGKIWNIPKDTKCAYFEQNLTKFLNIMCVLSCPTN